MGGFFGVASKNDAVLDTFFGVDYHSHLGTRRAGMAAMDAELGMQRKIHKIENSPFRTKFERILDEMEGNSRCDMLINEISAMESQIEIAKGENVRLNAELSSIISTDKIENYAENVLGMVKAENYQVSYIDLSGADEIVVSGDKTTGDASDLSGKIKELIAYIF